ncbi:MAG: hypothetical protein LAT81_14085 [Oceanicaulis sp.]|nr:hypothetical protein [Oceanicaulis sp.]
MIRLTAAGFATAAIAAAGLAATGAGAPAPAQTLSQGDFELCAIYRHDGSFAGYDTACLEAQRAAIRAYRDSRGSRYAPPPRRSYGYDGYGAASHAPAPMLCPSWANQGHGYPSTLPSGPNARIQYGTFTSSVNGRPCIANPVFYTRQW